MTHILCIETSTKNCSVSISKNGEILTVKEIAEDNYSHAENLHVFIQKILEESGLEKHQLHAIAVSKGPGSYTGLRIGVSAAKGLCYALDLPLISLDTLTILAQQKNISQGKIIPMIDARRMEVYTTVFDKDKIELTAVTSKIIDENSFANHDEDLYFIGDGAPKCQSVLNAKNHHFDSNILYPSAKDMCKLAFEKFKNNAFEDVAYFEPFYLKDFMVGGGLSN
jgi:tRNA threonylcarbamoyladenosine biosynthesis protein TsaB